MTNPKLNKALEAAHAKRQEMKERGEKVERLTPREKLAKKPTSYSLAIAAKCWECAGNGEDGNKVTRETIEMCTVDCALHAFRPYK